MVESTFSPNGVGSSLVRRVSPQTTAPTGGDCERDSAAGEGTPPGTTMNAPTPGGAFGSSLVFRWGGAVSPVHVHWVVGGCLCLASARIQDTVKHALS